VSIPSKLLFSILFVFPVLILGVVFPFLFVLFVVEALYDLPLAHQLVDFQLEIILLRVDEVRASLQALLSESMLTL
jgi:hypothetical protein